MRSFRERAWLWFLAVAITSVVMRSAHAGVINFYWTDRDAATVNKTTAGGVTTQLVAPTGGRLQDVDLAAGSTLYFTDWGPVGLPGGEGKLNRVSTAGGLVTNILTTGDGVHQIVLDQPNNKIYYTQGVSYDTKQIGVVNMDGTGHTILQNDPSWFASGIALDAANGKLYWGDIGVMAGYPYQGTVNVMNTNGTSPMELEPHENGRGRGYALYGGDIYLTAHDYLNPSSNGGIFVYNIASDILTPLITDPNGFWDLEIDPAGPRMYWTNYAAGRIESAKLDGTDRRIEQSGLSHPYGLALELGATCVFPPPQLRGWWRGENNTFDASGFGHNGILQGSPSPPYVSAEVGIGFNFDGIDDNVRVAHTTTLNFGTGDFSIDTWINPSDVSGIRPIVEKRTALNGTQPLGYLFYIHDGELRLLMTDPGGTFVYPSPVSIPTGTWSHVAVTVDRATPEVIFYLNGARVVHPYLVALTGTVDNGAPFYIGANMISLSGLGDPSYFAGKVDEVEIFTRVLDPSEINAIFSADSLGKCPPPVPALSPLGLLFSLMLLGSAGVLAAVRRRSA